MANVVRQTKKYLTRLPTSKELELFGTNGLLALIHDAIGHLVEPVQCLPKTMPLLKQIASDMSDQHQLLKEMLAVLLRNRQLGFSDLEIQRFEKLLANLSPGVVEIEAVAIAAVENAIQAGEAA